MQGRAEAQYNLGVIYYKGKDVPKDFVRAYAWFNLAAARDDDAKKYREATEKQMSPEQKAEGQKLSLELLAKMPKR